MPDLYSGNFIMRKTIFALAFIALTTSAFAQKTFKAGWNTYNTGTLTHEYTYNYSTTDSIRLFPSDSAVILTSPDSLVIMNSSYPIHDKSVYKTITYLNPKKQVIKTEEYKDDNLQLVKEWKYNDKNQKYAYTEDNKISGNNYRKSFDYSYDKKSGELVIAESSYYNGKIEFYTKSYYNKDNQKLKEVRLNDNNKDVVHIESYFYGENGKLKERSVYFPEWKVTKKFEEHEGSLLPKCNRAMPIGTSEKPLLSTRVAFIKRLLVRNAALLNSGDCTEFEYTFRNFTTCDVVVATTNMHNTRKVVFRLKEKM